MATFKFSGSIFRWAIMLVVVAVAAIAAVSVRSRMKAHQSHARAPIPYAVTLRETVRGSDGTAHSGPESTWAIRSDGSRVIKIRDKVSQRIINFASGVQVEINDSTNTKSSIMLPSGDVAGLQRDPDSQCINSRAGKPMTSSPETFAGEETIAGYRTVKIVRGGVTEWLALDYGCALVKDRWEFSTQEVSEKELVSLSAEPDAALFEIPATTREVTPSERLFGPQKECQDCDEHTKERFQKMDEEYRRLAVKPQ